MCNNPSNCGVSKSEMTKALAGRCALKFIYDQHFKKVVGLLKLGTIAHGKKSLDRSHIGAII
jgi:hypothetical protein